MKSITIAAVAGLTAAAAAQGVNLTFTASRSSMLVGETVSFTVSAEHTGQPDASAYYGGYVGTFDASDAGLGTSGNFMNLMAGEGTPATSNGASVATINIFNAALLGTDDQTNPLDIFTFDVTASSVGTLSYSAPGVNTVFPNDDIFTLGEEYTATVFSDSVTITPAPGALALLGLGGLAASRRRR